MKRKTRGLLINALFMTVLMWPSCLFALPKIKQPHYTKPAYLETKAKGSAPIPTIKPFPEPHKVLWKGNVTLKVSGFADAKDKAVEIAARYGGEPYSDWIKVMPNGRKYGEVEIRLPIEKRYDFMKEIYGLGKVYSQKVDAPDVTAEYVDDGRRLTALLAEEQQLLQVLKSARHVLEVLQVQYHLYNIRVEIERVTSERGEIAIKSQTALFSLDFFEPDIVKEPVYPGGIREFFPRWWQYTAMPVVKQRAKNTYYAYSGMFLDYALGSQAYIPNLAWLGIFLVVFVVFMKKIWPVCKANLAPATGFLKDTSIPVATIAWSLVFLYLLGHVFSANIAGIFLLFLMYQTWLGFSRREAGSRMLNYLAEKKVRPWIVHIALAIPLVSKVLGTVFPGALEDVMGAALLACTLLFVAALAINLTPLLIEKIKAEFARRAGESEAI